MTDSSRANTEGSIGTSDNNLFSSISDNFSWASTMAAINPNTGAKSAVVSPDAIGTGSATTTAKRSAAASTGLDASSVSDMNRTKNLVESTTGTDRSLFYYSSNTISARYAVTSSGEPLRLEISIFRPETRELLAELASQAGFDPVLSPCVSETVR